MLLPRKKKSYQHLLSMSLSKLFVNLPFSTVTVMISGILYSGWGFGGLSGVFTGSEEDTSSWTAPLTSTPRSASVLLSSMVEPKYKSQVSSDQIQIITSQRHEANFMWKAIKRFHFPSEKLVTVFSAILHYYPQVSCPRNILFINCPHFQCNTIRIVMFFLPLYIMSSLAAGIRTKPDNDTFNCDIGWAKGHAIVVTWAEGISTYFTVKINIVNIFKTK